VPTVVIVIFVIALVLLYFTKIRPQLSEASADRAKIKQTGIDFLEANKQKEDVVTLDSGMQYQVIQQGTGSSHPTAKSRVKVHYKGTFINGETFDSSFKRGRPAVFPLNQVIKGWTEGVQLMVEGEIRRFFIPPSLAYGNRWQGSIPPGSTLIFDVELIEILQDS
jgi:peptidylprolyl isomerase